MKKHRKLYIMSFMIPFLLMVFSFYYNKFFPFGFKSVMAIDFSQQFIDYFIFFKNKIFTGDFGNLFYSFSKSIGGNFIGVWSYYLNSPLNILYALTPLKYIDFTTVLIILIRYGLMGLTFTHFLVKRHGAGKYNRYLVLALSSAYALNGYNVSYQVVPIFYDAFWLMPLVLIGLEELLDGESPVKYILLLAATVFVQYYMGFMICLFIILYSVFYLVSKRREEPWGKYFRFIFLSLLRLAVSSVISIGLISWIFIPNLFNLLGSKVTDSPMKFDFKFQIDPMEILSKFFPGAFDNTSWPAGPNLPNIFVGSLAMAGAGFFFASKKIRKELKVCAGVILLIFFFSVAHEFTSKIWHLGQNPAGFFYRFSWLISFFLIYIAYLGLKDLKAIDTPFFSGALIVLAAVSAIVVKQNHTFMKPYQVVIGMILSAAVLIILYSEKMRDRFLILFTITVIELTANASISQFDLPYNSSYKFINALEVIGEAVKPLRPGKDDFWRISKSFTRSRNDPMSLDYPGLTHFSSNLEHNTREFMDNLGNNSVDMTTFYMGTPLTDALFSVKYFIANGDYRAKTNEEGDRTYYFGEDIERPDLTVNENFYGATERFRLYEIKNTLPIAFGVKDLVTQVNMVKNDPVLNQENIAKSLLPSNENYFTSVEPTGVKLTDATAVPESKAKFRATPDMEGKILYTFVPDSDDPYYVVLPENLSDYKDEITILLNGRNLKLRRKFTVNQLVTVASQSKGKEVRFEIKFKTKNPLDLSDFRIVKLDKAKTDSLIEDRKKQGMDLTSRGSNFINGKVNITDGSTLMLTSIPYDIGWKIKVDGKEAVPTEVFGALMAFPITQGEHEISMRYISPGFKEGVIVSLISLLTLIFLILKMNPDLIEKLKNRKKAVGEEQRDTENELHYSSHEAPVADENLMNSEKIPHEIKGIEEEPHDMDKEV